MSTNDYDPIGGHTKEEADAAYEALFRELHGCGPAVGFPDSVVDEATAGRRECVAVVGHTCPDTDCVCAAIAYARLKNVIDPGREYIPFRAGPLNGETEFVLREFGVEPPGLFSEYCMDSGNIKTVLIDHNKKSRRPEEGVGLYEVVEIIDHHRLKKIETAAPIMVRCEPWGATSTIIYEMYLEKGLAPDAQAAGLLCAGIISDTYLLRTEKTTARDRQACAALGIIAGTDIRELAERMFR